MRFILICDDNRVIINGVAKKLPSDFGLPPKIHAVQWYDNHGEIEYRKDDQGKKAPNEKITNLSQFQRFVDWFNGQT